MTDPPVIMTYSSVVSRDSVRIGFLLAALNDLELVAADIRKCISPGNYKGKDLCYSRSRIWGVAREVHGHC
jgi:hypothetical protein